MKLKKTPGGKWKFGSKWKLGGRLKSFFKFKKISPGRKWFFLAGVALVGVVAISLYYFGEDFFAVIPGYYKNYEYNSFTSKKNDLIEDNAGFFLANDDLNSKNSELGSTVEDFTSKIENNTQIVDNLEKISKNVDEILECDKQLRLMRLPYIVEKSVELYEDLDKVRRQLVGKSLEIVEARIGIDSFNKTRVEFDSCLVSIDWADSDQNIGDYIDSCNTKIDIMKDQISELEKTYNVELVELNNYLSLLEGQWEASVLYYRAIAKGDYNEANSHDAVFVEKKRVISELDPYIFNEFNELVINELVLEFGELSLEEQEKENISDDWYDNNLSR